MYRLIYAVVINPGPGSRDRYQLCGSDPFFLPDPDPTSQRVRKPDPGSTLAKMSHRHSRKYFLYPGFETCNLTSRVVPVISLARA